MPDARAGRAAHRGKRVRQLLQLFVFMGAIVVPGVVGAQLTVGDDPMEAASMATESPSEAAQSVQYAAAVLADNPIAYWRLGETDGSAADTSPLGTAAAVVGAVTTGRPGVLAGDASAAMAFDGAGGYLHSSAPIGVGADFSIEAWVKATSNTSPGTIVSLDAGSQSRTLYLDGSRFVGMSDLSADWPAYSVVSPDVDPTLWHHVVFSIQAGSALALYVDGVRVGSVTVPVRQGLTAPAVIGWSDATWMAHFTGTLDEVALYPTALAPEQVRAHFAAAGPVCGGALQPLIDAAEPGSVVTVPGCLYRETFRINKPLVLAGEPGAEIRGSDVWTTWTGRGGKWISQQTLPAFVPSSNRDGRCGQEAAARCLYPQQVFLDGRPLDLAPAGTQPAPGQFTVDEERHVIIADDPNGHTVEVSTRRRWIVTGSDGVTIQGLTMRHAANDALTGGLSNDGYSDWTVQHSSLSDAHGAVISLHNGTNLNVLANDISRGGDMGIHGDLITNSLVAGNRLHHHNTDLFNPIWGAGAVKITRTSGLRMESNEVDNNAGVGLWCDVRCTEVAFAGNRIHDNLHQGIFFEISEGATIRDNVVWQNGWGSDRVWGAGILVASSAVADVFGNVVAWNAAGITVIEQARQESVQPRDIQVHDNTVIASDGTVGLAWRSDPSAQHLFNPAAGNNGARNRYWFPSADGVRFGWSGERRSLDDFMQTPGETEGSYLSSSDKDEVLATSGVPLKPPDG